MIKQNKINRIQNLECQIRNNMAVPERRASCAKDGTGYIGRSEIGRKRLTVSIWKVKETLTAGSMCMRATRVSLGRIFRARNISIFGNESEQNAYLSEMR